MTIPRPWVFGIIVVVVLAGLLGLRAYGNQRAAAALWQERYAGLEQEKARTDTVMVRDTVRLTVVRHRTDSLLRVDTLFSVDTVRQIVQAERAACDTVIHACEARIAVRDTLIAHLKRQPKAVPLGCTTGGAALVTLSGRAYGGLGITCGLHFRLPL